MSKPLIIDLPHSLGAEEAKRRIGGGIGRLRDHIPGGAEVNSAWAGDRLNLDIKTMGQQVSAHIDVQERIVRVEVALPALLAMFGNKISSYLGRRGSELLEDKSGK